MSFFGTQAYGSSACSSNSGSNEEDETLQDLINTDARDSIGDEDGDEPIIEGRVTYIAPMSTFTMRQERNNTRRGYVQSYIVEDVLAKRSNKQIYSFRVTAWHEMATKRLVKIGQYVKIRRFAWKQSDLRSKYPAHQCKYDAHLRSDSIVDVVPHVPCKLVN